MKRCIAPCVHKCTKEEYDAYVNKTIKFLRGQDTLVLKELYDEMNHHAELLEFEQAAEILRTIRQIETTIEIQKVDKPLGIDIDALAIFREGDEVILTQLIFRGGKLIGSRSYDFTKIGEEDVELLETFLLQQYDSQQEMPHEILLPELPDDSEALSDIISKDKRRVQLLAPQRGEKKSLVEMALANAQATFKQKKDALLIRERTLLQLQERFHLVHYPERIECFDNSNLAGTQVVSTLVAFTEGKKDAARYRKYKIKDVAGSDDYAALREVLTRRFQKAKETDDLPDLLLIDGGKGHLNVALKVLAELNIVSTDVIAIAKEQGRHDKGITREQVFLPNLKDPIILTVTSPVLFLLQQIRDEAHRTSLAYQRKRRSKTTFRSAVDDIAGIGPKKRKILLTHFGSVKQLMEATEEDLKKVAGLNQTNRQAIWQYIKRSKNETI